MTEQLKHNKFIKEEKIRAEEIIGENEYSEFFNTRIESLTIEDCNNENKINELMTIKKEDDYAEEYEDVIEKIFNGDINSDNKVKEVLDICSKTNLDLSNAHLAKSEDEKGEIFWSILSIIAENKKPEIKAKSLDIAIEQQKNKGINFEGFDKDDDFSEVHNFLQKSFPNGLLDKALISRLSYLPDIVCISINGNFFLSKDKYLEWKNKYKDLTKYKIRAVNRGSSNSSLHTLFHSSPIEIYSFIDEDLNSLEYLKDQPEDRKMQIYKLGTISHEVGHNFYINLLDISLKNKWQKIIDSVGHITYYSEKYSNGIHGNKIRYDEEFAEAIRLITTSREYLKQKFSEVYKFLTDIFPELNKKNNI